MRMKHWWSDTDRGKPSTRIRTSFNYLDVLTVCSLGPPSVIQRSEKCSKVASFRFLFSLFVSFDCQYITDSMEHSPS